MENIIEKPHVGPKEFFVHLFSFALLYAFAVSFIGLWWEYINFKFPDALQPYWGFDQIRFPLAVLIIVFPVFVFLARRTTQAIAADPMKKELWIYRWLVYLTLFVSAVTVVVDLVTLLYNYLGGDLTARFGLKVFVVLIVAAGIFGYYLWHLRSTVSMTARPRRAFLWGSIIIVTGSVVLGFVMVGSPARARLQRSDMNMIGEMQSISYQIQDEYNRTKKLPATIEKYEYRITGSTTYQLCATFNTSSVTQRDQDSWWHAAGRYCYDLDAKSIPWGPKSIRID